MKTTEWHFCETTGDAASSLLTVRPGMDAQDALEHASTIIDAVARGMKDTVENEASPPAALCWALGESLDVAKALINSVVSASMKNNTQ